jgi:hypothetical protein
MLFSLYKRDTLRCVFSNQHDFMVHYMNYDVFLCECCSYSSSFLKLASSISGLLSLGMQKVTSQTLTLHLTGRFF